MPEEKKEAQTEKKKVKRIPKSTVTIGRNTIKTKQAFLEEKDKAKIVAETLEILKLTDEDVAPDGKIIKKDKNG